MIENSLTYRTENKKQVKLFHLKEIKEIEASHLKKKSFCDDFLLRIEVNKVVLSIVLVLQ